VDVKEKKMSGKNFIAWLISTAFHGGVFFTVTQLLAKDTSTKTLIILGIGILSFISLIFLKGHIKGTFFVTTFLMLDATLFYYWKDLDVVVTVIGLILVILQALGLIILIYMVQAAESGKMHDKIKSFCKAKFERTEEVNACVNHIISRRR